MITEHQDTLNAVKTLVDYMRAGGARDELIRAGLVAEGWPVIVVISALTDSDRHGVATNIEDIQKRTKTDS